MSISGKPDESGEAVSGLSVLQGGVLAVIAFLLALPAAFISLMVFLDHCVLGDDPSDGPVPGSAKDDLCRAVDRGAAPLASLALGVLGVLAVAVVALRRRDLSDRARLLLVLTPAALVLLPTAALVSLPG